MAIYPNAQTSNSAVILSADIKLIQGFTPLIINSGHQNIVFSRFLATSLSEAPVINNIPLKHLIHSLHGNWLKAQSFWNKVSPLLRCMNSLQSLNFFTNFPLQLNLQYLINNKKYYNVLELRILCVLWAQKLWRHKLRHWLCFMNVSIYRVSM